MLQAKLLNPTASTPENTAAKNLYNASFPAAERVPFNALCIAPYDAYQLYAFYDAAQLIGIAHFIALSKFVHLNYLAVAPQVRGHGYGTQIINWLKSQYPNHAIIADIEVPDPNHPDATARDARRRFYERNGFQNSGIQFDWATDTLTPMLSAPLDINEFLQQLRKVAPDIKNVRSY